MPMLQEERCGAGDPQDGGVARAAGGHHPAGQPLRLRGAFLACDMDEEQPGQERREGEQELMNQFTRSELALGMHETS